MGRIDVYFQYIGFEIPVRQPNQITVFKQSNMVVGLEKICVGAIGV